MTRIRSAAIAAFAVSTACAAVCIAGAPSSESISTKSMLVTDNVSKPTKRKIVLSSVDPGIALSDVGDPSANGASLHIYSATDDFCAVLPPSAVDWKLKKGQWKYKVKGQKNTASIKNAKLTFKVAQNVTYTLADNGMQGVVNAIVRFGNAPGYCLRCTGNKKDDAKKFSGKPCAPATCDVEPSSCPPLPTTTTTSSTTTTTSGGGGTTTTTSGATTTTTTQPAGGVELKGALPPSTGLFNYAMTLGIAGADAACNSNFPGTHACLYSELLTAEAAGDLDGLEDTNGGTVTSLWAIDPTHDDDLQCTVSVPWDYQTAHTGQFGERVTLTTATGDLGPLQSGEGDLVFCAVQNWVGCCL